MGVKSIDTGVADRDAHPRGPDFCDAERIPQITFRCNRLEGSPPEEEGDGFQVVGDLLKRTHVPQESWSRSRVCLSINSEEVT